MDPARATSHLGLSIDGEVRAAESAAIALLRQLIRTPSVSGTEGSAADPSSVAGTLWESLAPWPVARVAEPVFPGRDNVLAVLRGSGPNAVVLDAHTDTVPPGDPALWFDGEPYSAAEGTVSYLGHDRVRLDVGGLVVERPIRRRLGRLWDARGFTSAPVIYGRGSFDNKGPVAVAWLATTALGRTLANHGLRLKGTLVCGFTIDEEAAMAGVRALAGGPGCWLDRQGLLPPAREGVGFREGIWGVALDGSYGFVPVVGHRGIAQLLVRTHGQAAHAATPALGRNAVTMMASVLSSLATDSSGLEHELSSLFADDLLEPATLALGTTIVGGGVEAVIQTASGRVVDRRGINVVPDWCESTIDCRHPRPADDDVASIQKRIAETIKLRALASTGLPEAALDVDVLGGGPPCAILDRVEDGWDDPLVGSVLRHGESVAGFPFWVETAPGGTDATVMINDGGIRSIVEFGPAGGFAHEPHEFVERDQIALGARILARVVVDLLGVEQDV